MPPHQLRPADLVGPLESRISQQRELLCHIGQVEVAQKVLQTDPHDLPHFEPAKGRPGPLWSLHLGDHPAQLLDQVSPGFAAAEQARLQQPLKILREANQDVGEMLGAAKDGERKIEGLGAVPEEREQESPIKDSLGIPFEVVEGHVRVREVAEPIQQQGKDRLE